MIENEKSRSGSKTYRIMFLIIVKTLFWQRRLLTENFESIFFQSGWACPRYGQDDLEPIIRTSSWLPANHREPGNSKM